MSRTSFPEFPGAGGPVCDLHTHIQPWKMLKPEALATIQSGRNDLDRLARFIAEPEALLAHMDDLGIARIGIVNYPTELLGFTEEVNEFSTRYAQAAPERIIPFGGVLLTDRRSKVARALDDAIEMGVKCVKVHPPHQKVAPNGYLFDREHPLRAVYEGCQAADIPVMVHSGTSVFPGARSRFGDPMGVDDVAVDFPDLRIIVAHAGRPLWGPTAAFLARRHPNVWLDLSSIPPKRLLEYLPDLPRLAQKCLWGTDWPGPGVRTMADNVKQFLELDLPKPVVRKVLWENSLRLFPV